MEVETDKAYRERLALVVYNAVVEASRDADGQAVVRTGSAFDALMMIAAVLIAGSPELGSPQSVRLFCEAQAKKLRHEINAARDDGRRRELFGPEIDPDRLN